MTKNQIKMAHCDIKLDIQSFYDNMEKDYKLRFDFKPSVGLSGSTREECIDLTKRLFHRHIQEAFHDWVMYKVFDQRNGDHDYDLFVDVWEFLRDVAIAYSRILHYQVVLIFEDEDDE